jgi:hypothetical protein
MPSSCIFSIELMFNTLYARHRNIAAKNLLSGL